jgi:hypothetical protein
LPTGLATGKVLGRVEIEEVLVVGENDDRVRVPFKIVAPCLQGTDDHKEFSIVDLIVDLIVALSRIE